MAKCRVYECEEAALPYSEYCSGHGAMWFLLEQLGVSEEAWAQFLTQHPGKFTIDDLKDLLRRAGHRLKTPGGGSTNNSGSVP